MSCGCQARFFKETLKRVCNVLKHVENTPQAHIDRQHTNVLVVNNKQLLCVGLALLNENLFIRMLSVIELFVVVWPCYTTI